MHTFFHAYLPTYLPAYIHNKLELVKFCKSCKLFSMCLFKHSLEQYGQKMDSKKFFQNFSHAYFCVKTKWNGLRIATSVTKVFSRDKCVFPKASSIKYFQLLSFFYGGLRVTLNYSYNNSKKMVYSKSVWMWHSLGTDWGGRIVWKVGG